MTKNRVDLGFIASGRRASDVLSLGEDLLLFLTSDIILHLCERTSAHSIVELDSLLLPKLLANLTKSIDSASMKL